MNVPGGSRNDEKELLDERRQVTRGLRGLLSSLDEQFLEVL